MQWTIILPKISEPTSYDFRCPCHSRSKVFETGGGGDDGGAGNEQDDEGDKKKKTDSHSELKDFAYKFKTIYRR